MNLILLFSFAAFVGYMEGRYVFMNIKKNRRKANQYCSSNGMVLVQIETETENTFIFDFVQSLTNHANYDIWIGLRYKKLEDQYIWPNKSFTSVIYTPTGNLMLENVTCIRMNNHQNGAWYTGDCSKDKYRFVCEYAVDAPITDRTILIFDKVNGNFTGHGKGIMNVQGTFFANSRIREQRHLALQMITSYSAVDCLSVCNYKGDTCTFAAYTPCIENCVLYGEDVTFINF